MKKPILFLLIASSIACGAVTTNTVWEVWNTGASSNGGCFDSSVPAPGTDHSQQAASQKTYTDLAINGADNTKATSAANPFVASDAGNCYNITGGPGFTVKRVVLLSVSGSVGTFNESLGTAGSTGGAANMGGALDTITRPTVVAGNTVYVKATGTYTISATQLFNVAGTAGNPITYIGYTSTRGDNGMVTVQRVSGATVSVFSASGAFQRFRNFIADANGGTTTRGFVMSAPNIIFDRCKATQFTVSGFEVLGSTTNGTFQNCWATGGTSGATGAFITGLGSVSGIAFHNCAATGNSSSGFVIQTATSSNRIVFNRCISANNTGSPAYHGFVTTSGSSINLLNSVAYNNSGNGLLVDHATGGDALVVLNSIFVNNGLYGISSNITNHAASGKYQLLLNYNAFFGNGTARNNVAAGDNDVSLAGDPFTNGGSGLFTLNSTHGAALKAAGFPGVLQFGGTGSLDIGPLQSSGAGGGGQKGYPWVGKAGKPMRVDAAMYEMVHPQFQNGIQWPFNLYETFCAALPACIAVMAAKLARRTR